MKRLIFIFTLALLVSPIFMDCKNTDDNTCISKDKNDLVFTAAEINSIVPYDNIAKYTFKDSLGDSVSYSPIHPHQSIIWSNIRNEVCDNKTHSEHEVDIASRCNEDTTFFITLRLVYYYNTEDVPTKSFGLFFYNNYSSVDSTIFQFSNGYLFEGTTIYLYPNNASIYLSACHPTFIILSHTYNSVYEMNNPSDSITTVYYSAAQGIVGYKEASGKLWYLDKIN